MSFLSSIASTVKSAFTSVVNKIFGEPKPERELVRDRESILKENVEKIKSGVKNNRTIIAVRDLISGEMIYRPAGNAISIDESSGETGSDKQFQNVLTRPETEIEFINVSPSNKENSGSFFKGWVNEVVYENLKTLGLDLNDFQIYTKEQFHNNEHSKNCLWYCLRDYKDKLDLSIIDETPNTEAVRIRFLKRIANKINIRIQVESVSENGSKFKTYGNKDCQEVLNLGCFENHYINNVDLKFTTSLINLSGKTAIPSLWLIKNIDLKSENMIENLHRQMGTRNFKLRVKEMDKQTRVPKLLRLLKHLKDENLFTTFDNETELSLPDCHKSKSSDNIFYQDLYIPDVIFSTEKPSTAFQPTPKSPPRIWYADFETTTNESKHTPYLAAAVTRDVEKLSSNLMNQIKTVRVFSPKSMREHKESWLGKNLLEKIVEFDPRTTNHLLYFHNLKYDATFLMPFLIGIEVVESGGKIFSLKGQFIHNGKTYKIQLKDSYCFISSKLAEFPKMFGFTEEKYADFPYDLFVRKNLTSHEVLLDEDEAKRIPDEYKMRATQSENKFAVSMYNFGLDYCVRDCVVLMKGMEVFREDVKKLDIDLESVYSVSGLAKKYMEINGAFDDVEKVSNIVRSYIQESVVGGRVMTRNNEVVSYESKSRNEDLIDFDAVSLYPTAMSQLPGLPTGHPTKFMGNPPVSATFYVATVRIKKINKRYNFPCISEKNKEGREWSNDPEGKVMILNNQQIEDIQNFHQGEVEIIGGLYWTGWNDKITKIIKKLFNWRLQLKKEKNSLQLVVKLIMNSVYGKMIQKPVNHGFAFLRGDLHTVLSKALSKGMGFVEALKITDKFYRVKYIEHDFNYSNYAHCGSLILSQSKRIMYDTMCPVDEHIMYTDTDSMIIQREGIDKLKKEKPQIFGNQMGQFHSDFEALDNSNAETYSRKALFMGKKLYCCELTNDKEKIGYHTRIKGVPASSIEHQKRKLNLDDLSLLYKCHDEGVEFDLLEDGLRCRFNHTGVSVSNLKEFKRFIN
jgi:hypothetical protein